MQKIKINPMLKLNKFKISKTAILAVFLITLIAVFGLLATTVLAQASLGLEVPAGTGLGTRDLKDLIMSIVQILLGFLGIAAIIVILYGGYIYMTSEGEPDNIDRAKKILINGVVGLVIILSAFAIVTYIISRMQEITNGGQGVGQGPGYTLNGGALGGGVLEAVYPEPGATGVPMNTLIMVMFNEEMDAGTIINQSNPAGCSLAPANVTCGIIAGDQDDPNIKVINQSLAGTFLEADEVIVMTSDNKSFVFDPVGYLGSFDEFQNYTVNLAQAIDRANGQPAFMAGGYSWSFQVSNELDLEPPYVTEVIPLADQAVYMNSIIQINFNEAVNVVAATLANNIVIANQATGDIVTGSLIVSNMFKTVEFVSDQPCPMPPGQPTNSCGEVPTCLPSLSEISNLVKAALVDGNGNTLDPFSGLNDAAANSLDGGQNNVNTGATNLNGQADGRPADGEDQFNTSVPNDNYWWNFSTTDALDIDPPQIIEVILDQSGQTIQESLSPDDEDSLIPRNAYVKAIFNEYLRSSTLNTNNIKVFNETLCNNEYGDCVMNDNEDWPLEISICDYSLAGTCIFPRGGFSILMNNYPTLLTNNLGQLDNVTKVSLKTYYPYLDPLTRYNPRITSEVQDMYQNCFYLSTGPNSN